MTAELAQAIAKWPTITQFLRLQWVDFTGTVRLRILPIGAAKNRAKAAGDGGWDLGVTAAVFSIIHDDHPAVGSFSASGMYGLAPAWDSLRPLPPTTHAMVACDITPGLGGSGSAPPCPRTALRRAVDRAQRDHALELLVGFETEVVFLTRKNDATQAAERPAYHAWSTASAMTPAHTELLDEITARLTAADIEVVMLHPESADGQFEVVTGPLPPVAAVDALYATRQIISTVAERHGLRATLHPKPMPAQCGSSAHVHFSLGATAAAAALGVEKPFVAGVLRRLRALCAFSMASVPSYRRRADYAWAGGTWVAWGAENRETPLRRIVHSHSPHWELRCVDASANAYLLVAALICAGLAGIAQAEVLPPDCSENPADLNDAARSALGVVEELPSSLTEAVDLLDGDLDLREALGRDLVDRYIACKKSEIAQHSDLFKTLTTDELWRWEIERY